MKTTISVSVDKSAKESAQAIAKSAGITLSTLVNAYFNQVAATRRIEIYAPEPMTPKLEKLIGKAEKEIARGETIGPFDNVDDFLAALKS
ncbi:type II toxin-antitoxin system RelB/DinJ family antitoxin [Candidatus Saccharibacteria bacterium]|nr:type II toxin-antitoxin system RelB/DinJ family antitoxin [Candidatus Saccharibacteria bacterium]